jgi:hypothetical protein
VWDTYWETVRESGIDWFILGLGGALIVAHVVGLLMRWQGKKVFFVQHLDRYRTVCLALTELLPVLGLLGTVLSLMNTFKGFQAAPGEAPDLAQTLRTFAPALSATLSGLLMITPNLVLNALLWMACPPAPNEEA